MTIGGVVAVLALVAGGLLAVKALGDDGPDTSLARAVAMAPDDSLQLSWIDWTAVRRELRATVSSDSSPALVDAFAEDAFNADLVQKSALRSSAGAMQRRLGFSPASIDWELFSQGDAQATLLIHVGDAVDLDAVPDLLRAAGYSEPEGEDGVWAADPETDEVTTELVPELYFLAFDPERRIVIASDTAAGIATAMAAESDASSEPISNDVLSTVGAPVTALLLTGSQVCSKLAMAGADPEEQSVADSLLATAGDINPIADFGIARDPGGDVRVVMTFETEEQARINADTRAALASGPAPGQGGDFSDRFVLGSATAKGDVVTLVLEPVDDYPYVFSDLSTGPVLFATC